MRLLAISGSLRRSSYNGALLGTAAAEARPGIDVVRWSGLDLIPSYSEDAQSQPECVGRLKQEIARADAVLFATPEYNASVPGALKNALDWISRPFDGNPLRNKPVAVVGASEGAFGAMWAQAELRKILRTMGAAVHDDGLAVSHAHLAFGTDGLLHDPQQRAVLRAILDALEARIRRRAA